MPNSAESLDQPFDQVLQRRIVKANHRISKVLQWRLYIAALILSDAVMILSAFGLAYIIRFQFNIPLFRVFVVPSFLYYLEVTAVLVPVWLVIFAFRGLYSPDKLLGGTYEYSQVFNSVIIGLILVIAAGFLIEWIVISRGWMLMAWIFSFLLPCLGRFLLRHLIYGLRQFGYFVSPVIIIGANLEGIQLAEQLTQWKTSGFHVVGFIDKKLCTGATVWKGLSCMGDIEHLDDIIEKYDIEEIVLASSAVSTRDRLMDIFKKYGINSRVKVRFSSGLYEIITTGLTINHIAYVPLMCINPVRLTGMDKALKMILDYTLTVLIIIFISPILLIIAAAIKFDSRGPIIHRRKVVGVNGKRFYAFKFRSMVVNGDEIMAEHPELQIELAKNHKLKKDPRITRVGGFLRRTSLDELPQLFNVLFGNMSLVGPRMIAPEELAKYQKYDINLLTVRPGMTGLWQVSGRSDISYEERVRLDMHYIRNWTIFLDIQLLFQTIPAVLKSRGAY
jgi:exopolysaccharide biosynthesis polyprenyl glycosylphosphotransferase